MLDPSIEESCELELIGYGFEEGVASSLGEHVEVHSPFFFIVGMVVEGDPRRGDTHFD